jgi:transcriptional regulator with XRE-family HTH domain
MAYTSKLAQLREAAGLTQTQLGELLAGKDTKTRAFQPRISAYELGTKTMPLPVAHRLMKVLNVALKKAGSKKRAKIEDLIYAPVER